jgi:hypothetical protein
MTVFLETMGIIHNVSPPYAHERNSLPNHMNRTIVIMVRSMTLNYTNVIPQALWAVAYSLAIHIKNHLPHSVFKLIKSLYDIIFGNRPSIKHLYPFGAKCYVYGSEEKKTGTSKLSPRGIKYNVVGYTRLSKLLRLYSPQKHRLFTSRDVVFPDSTKCLKSTKIESLPDLPIDQDDNAPWTIDQKRDLWEWIVKNLDEVINWAENRNPILHKFIRFC